MPAHAVLLITVGHSVRNPKEWRYLSYTRGTLACVVVARCAAPAVFLLTVVDCGLCVRLLPRLH
jgi:hypothetical protein